MLTLAVILLLACVLLGAFSNARLGYAAWSPAGTMLAALVVLFLLGYR
jgi:hypothetical protein